jgi:hypothetical protein
VSLRDSLQKNVRFFLEPEGECSWRRVEP